MKSRILPLLILCLNFLFVNSARSQCENSDWGAWTQTCIPGLDFRVLYEQQNPFADPPRVHMWRLEFRNNTIQEIELSYAITSPNEPTPSDPNEFRDPRRTKVPPFSVRGSPWHFLDVDCTSFVYLYTWSVLIGGDSYECAFTETDIDVDTPEPEGGGTGNQGDPLPPPAPPRAPAGSAIDHTAYECTSGSFTAIVGSDLWPVTVRWEIDGVLQPPQEIHWGQTAAYTIPSVTMAHNGKRGRAFLSTSAGSSWTDYSTLTVIPGEAPTALSKSPSSQTIHEGEYFEIKLTHSGTPPFTHELLFNGEPIPSSTPRFFYGESASIAGIWQYKAAVSHAGTYSIRVSNCAGTLEEEFTLNVIQATPTSVLENPIVQTYPQLDGLAAYKDGLFDSVSGRWHSCPAEGLNGDKWFVGNLWRNKTITFGSTVIPAAPSHQRLLLRYSATGQPLSAIVLPTVFIPHSISVANNGDLLLSTVLKRKPTGEPGLFWRFDYGPHRIENDQRMGIAIRLNARGQYLGYRLLCTNPVGLAVTELPNGHLGVIASINQNTSIHDPSGLLIDTSGSNFDNTYAFVLNSVGQVFFNGQSTAEEIGNSRFVSTRIRRNGELSLLFQHGNGILPVPIDWSKATTGSHIRTDGTHTQLTHVHWRGSFTDTGYPFQWTEDNDRQLLIGRFSGSAANSGGFLDRAVPGEANIMMLNLTEPGINFDTFKVSGNFHLHHPLASLEALGIIPLDNGEWFGAFRSPGPIDLGNGLTTPNPPTETFLLRLSHTGIPLEVIALDYIPENIFRSGETVRIWGVGNTAHGQAVDFTYFAIDYHLRPFVAPTVESITSPPVITPGTPATFTAQTTGDGTISYLWKVNGIAIVDATSSTLTHTFAPEEFGPALIQVEAFNEYGTTTSYHLDIQVSPPFNPPSLDTLSGPTMAEPGQWVELSINATGSGNIQYIWYRNDIPIPGNNQPFLRLALHSPDSYATETFKVIAYNEAGSTVSNSHSILVTNDPLYGEDYVEWAMRTIIPTRAPWWPELDADGDGQDNNFSYWSGADPLGWDAYPVFSMVGNARTFEYAVSLRVPGVQVFMEASDDARTWTMLNATPVYLRRENHRAIWRHSVNEVWEPHRFYRLKYVKN